MRRGSDTMELFLEIPYMCRLEYAIRSARTVASLGSNYNERVVLFDFNDTIVSVRWDSDPELLLRDFSRPSCGIAYREVGPYPNLVLTDEERESDARSAAETRRILAEYRSEEDAQRARTEARLLTAPEMEFSNKDAWDQAVREFEDDSSILAYAERWARLMQLELSQGKTLAAVWQQTSHDADFGDMSGSTQALATHLLTECWVRGTGLRRLHNARWGVVSDEGTVNPAVITLRAG